MNVTGAALAASSPAAGRRGRPLLSGAQGPSAALLVLLITGAVVNSVLAGYPARSPLGDVLSVAVVSGSILLALGSLSQQEDSPRFRDLGAGAVALLGMAQLLLMAPAAGWEPPALAAGLLHGAGAAALCAACALMALAGPQPRDMAVFVLNFGGAWVLVAAISAPATVTPLLAQGSVLVVVESALASGPASLALAAALAAGATIRPGLRHPLTWVVVAAALTWGTDLAGATTWADHLGPIPQLAALTSLPMLALAVRGLPGHPPAPAHRPTPWSVALPLLGTTAAVLGEIGTSQLHLPLLLHAVLPGLGLICLGATGWRLRHAARATRAADQAHRGTDPLTKLIDRHGLNRHLDRQTAPLALLVVDLVGVRQINEEVGHDLGDQALTEVAARLDLLAGTTGIAARIDGDDFALVLPATHVPDARRAAAQVQDTIRHPVLLQGHRLHLNANVGVVISHDPPSIQSPGSSWPDQLMRCADQALAEAQTRSAGIAVHDDDVCAAVVEDHLLHEVDALHTALAEGTGLLVHLQPQHHLTHPGPLAASTLAGCEALVRWQHPTRGLLGPDVVLRAARLGHLGRLLTNRVLELALSSAATWWFTHSLPVAVNLTAEDLDDPALPSIVTEALARHGLPPRALNIEVVEDSLMVDPDRAITALTALRELGCKIALDDYGTGYSSLAWLHRLPVDAIKIDRSLVDGIADDPAAAAIVEHSISLAHALGLLVLAEGVEREADLNLIRGLKCDYVQGYLTGRPLPFDAWHTRIAQLHD